MTSMGKFEARQRLTVVRKLWGQVSIAPRGVVDQSFKRINSPIIPPPTRKSRVWLSGAAPTCLNVNALITSGVILVKGAEGESYQRRE
jgi:hypothetical protein